MQTGPENQLDRVYIVAVMQDGSKIGYEIPLSESKSWLGEGFSIDTQGPVYEHDIFDPLSVGRVVDPGSTTFTVVTKGRYTMFTPEFFDAPVTPPMKEISDGS